MNKTLADFDASMRILHHNINAYYGGFTDAYRVVAVELRKMLCDKNRGKDISLLPRVFVDLRLHQLRTTAMFQDTSHKALMDSIWHSMPAILSATERGVPKVELLFDESKDRLEVQEWIEQPFFNRDDTIKMVIRSVADIESAHSDADYNQTLEYARSVEYFGTKSHLAAIIAIAEYVFSLIQVEQPTVRPELYKT